MTDKDIAQAEQGTSLTKYSGKPADWSLFETNFLRHLKMMDLRDERNRHLNSVWNDISGFKRLPMLTQDIDPPELPDSRHRSARIT